ncbi:MAG: metallophosphoesterase family protein [Patescibacteria group bacterium]|nr:metallophosphoesterase family protein [Patescibacteria group bacterium]
MKKQQVNFLVFSDMHDRINGPENIERWLKQEKIDAIISCGDITSAQTPDQIGQIKKVINVIKKHKLPFFTIAGNNEREETVEFFKKEKVFLEETNFLSYHLVGISGWGEIIPNLDKSINQNTILLTHVPPKITNKINLENAPFLHLHGHSHMPYNKKVFGKTTIINVPPLMNNTALMINLPNLKIKILQ